MKYAFTWFLLLFPFLTRAQITYPEAGEVWYPGDRVLVEWNPVTLGQTVVILLSSSENPYPGGELTHNWEYISSDPVGNTGSFGWVVPDDITTSDRTYRILVFGNLPNRYLVSEVIHVRFGRKRTLDPILTIKEHGDKVIITWSGIFRNTYQLEESYDLQGWEVRQEVRATDEVVELTLPVTETPHYFRLFDITE